MGFLDPATDILDVVLTGEGQRLFAQGKLRFVYWSVFDDEIDYNSYVSNSGSITAAEVTASKTTQLENGPIREAVTGYRTFNQVTFDRTNVYRPLFTIPQGQTVVPKIVKLHRTGSSGISLRQRKVTDKFKRKDTYGDPKVTDQIDRGFERVDASSISLEYMYTPNSFPEEKTLEGLKVRVYSSGSDGLIEIYPKRDLDGEIAFGSELGFNKKKNKNRAKIP